MHVHYRESEELRRPHLMVCSSEPLDYPVLEDYATLLSPPAGAEAKGSRASSWTSV